MSIETLRPNATGDIWSWVSGPTPYDYTQIDEVTADDDTTYASTASDIFQFLVHIQDTGLTTETINSVTVFSRDRHTTNNDDLVNAKIIIKTVSTVYKSANINDTLTYANYSNIWTVNPNTGVAWTVAQINALQIGMERVLGYWGNPNRCTQMWVEVDYTAGGGQTISGVGNIISAQVLGKAVLNLRISPVAIASTEASGKVNLNLKILPIAIASAQTLGTPKINLSIIPVGIPSNETLGTAKLNQLVNLKGIISAEALGKLIISIGGQFITGVGGIVSTETFGTLKLSRKIQTVGIISAEALGRLIISVGGQFITGVGGIASAETPGVPRFNLGLHPVGITSSERIGTTQFLLVLKPSGIPSSEALGKSRMVLEIHAAGIPSEEKIGIPLFVYPRILSAGGIVSLELLGKITILAGPEISRILWTQINLLNPNLTSRNVRKSKLTTPEIRKSKLVNGKLLGGSDPSGVPFKGEQARYTGILKDQDGVVIPASSLVSLLLTFRDKETAQIINSRNLQNILNTNNVTLDTAGNLVWQLQVEDNIVLDSNVVLGDLEMHVAIFKWQTVAGLIGKFSEMIPVRNQN